MRQRVADAEHDVERVLPAVRRQRLPGADRRVHVRAVVLGQLLRARHHRRARVGRDDLVAAQGEADGERARAAGAVEHARRRHGLRERLRAALRREQRIGHEEVVDGGDRVVAAGGSATAIEILAPSRRRVAAPAAWRGSTQALTTRMPCSALASQVSRPASSGLRRAHAHLHAALARDGQQQPPRDAGQRALARASCTARRPPTTAGSRARPRAAPRRRRTAAARRRRGRGRSRAGRRAARDRAPCGAGSGAGRRAHRRRRAPRAPAAARAGGAALGRRPSVRRAETSAPPAAAPRSPRRRSREVVALHAGGRQEAAKRSQCAPAARS